MPWLCGGASRGDLYVEGWPAVSDATTLWQGKRPAREEISFRTRSFQTDSCRNSADLPPEQRPLRRVADSVTEVPTGLPNNPASFKSPSASCLKKSPDNESKAKRFSGTKRLSWREPLSETDHYDAFTEWGKQIKLARAREGQAILARATEENILARAMDALSLEGHNDPRRRGSDASLEEPIMQHRKDSLLMDQIPPYLARIAESSNAMSDETSSRRWFGRTYDSFRTRLRECYHSCTRRGAVGPSQDGSTFSGATGTKGGKVRMSWIKLFGQQHPQLREAVEEVLEDAVHRQLAQMNLQLPDTVCSVLLMIAAEGGNEGAVRHLLQAGAAADAADTTGNTALMRAAAGGNEGVVRLLLEAGSPVDAANTTGNTALMRAAAGGNEGALCVLLEAGAAIDATNADGNEGALCVLLEAGAAVDATNADGMTALMAAAKEGHEGAIRLLLAAGAAADRADEYGVTALMAAAHGGKEGAMAALLAAGVPVNAVAKDGCTALMLAAEDGRAGAVALLLGCGAAADMANREDQTALMLASNGGLHHKEAIRLLLSAKGDDRLEPSQRRRGSVDHNPLGIRRSNSDDDLLRQVADHRKVHW